MLKLYKLFASITILAILVVTIMLSFWVIIFGGILFGIFRLYRYFFGKRSCSGNFETRNHNYHSGEIVDIRAKMIREKIEK